MSWRFARVSLAKCVNFAEIQWNLKLIPLKFCKGCPLQNVWTSLNFNKLLRGYPSGFQQNPFISSRFARGTSCKMYEFQWKPMNSYGDAPQDFIEIHWFPDISQGIPLHLSMNFIDIRWNVNGGTPRDFSKINRFPDVLLGVPLAKCMNVIENSTKSSGDTPQNFIEVHCFSHVLQGVPPLQNVWIALQFDENLRGYSSGFHRNSLISRRFAKGTPCEMYESYWCWIKS